ncbi:family 4 glycosyl hydrolase [Paenibacillus plantarum]|uniref:family 4 glycosyl hydrolase n=1 Tax=Paenibacillus plantarum TaxID=2654975 RepID=UPI0035E4319D
MDPCVGDTLGPGGVFFGLRTIPVLLDLAKDIRELAANAPESIIRHGLSNWLIKVEI